MKRWIAVLVVMMAIVPCCARADEVSKQVKVRELFATMHMERQLDQMMHSIEMQVQMMAQEIPGAGDQLTPEQKKLSQEFTDKAMKVVNDNAGWTALEPDYVKLYASTYSEEEIDGILAFYKSPVGQTMLAKTPELSTGGMKIMHDRMMVFQPKVRALQEEYIKQLAALPPATKP